VKPEKRLEEGYREMASDREHEDDATEWVEALIGDSSGAVSEWFDKLDKLRSDPFPACRRHPTTPKRDLFN